MFANFLFLFLTRFESLDSFRLLKDVDNECIKDVEKVELILLCER